MDNNIIQSSHTVIKNNDDYSYFVAYILHKHIHMKFARIPRKRYVINCYTVTTIHGIEVTLWGIYNL